MGDEFPVIGMATTPFLGPYRIMQNGVAANMGHLAFDIRDMDFGPLAGPPAEGLEVITARFDPKAAGDALGACAKCPGHGLVQYGGVSYYRWGEDPEVGLGLICTPPTLDRLGQGRRVAVLESYILRTLTTEGMASIIDALAVENSSSLGAEEFRLLGVGLSRFEPYRAMLSDLDCRLDTIVDTLFQGEWIIRKRQRLVISALWCRSVGSWSDKCPAYRMTTSSSDT